jgi:hypothetical protein
MTNHANPFAPLIDPASILAACATSESLSTLPAHAHHCADLPSDKVSKDLAEFDAAIDAIAISSPALRKRYRRSGGVERQPDLAASVAESMLASVAPPHVGAETLAVSSGGARAVPEMPVATLEGTKDSWWSAPVSWYLRQLTFFGILTVTR